MASFTRSKNATLQKQVKSLSKQLAESGLYTVILQTTIKETQNISVFTDLDYKHITAAMYQQCSRDQSQDHDRRDRSTTALSEKEHRSLKQPDPPLLSDSKDPTYMSWSILVQAKLQDNNDHFLSENSKLIYVYGCTTRAAQAHLEPWFEYNVSNLFYTVDKVIAHLVAIYQNLIQQAIVQDRYYDLSQGCTELFSEFLTKFQHLTELRAVLAANWQQDLYHKLNVLYQKNIVLTLLFYNMFEKLVAQC
jgi:hypothetical protein